MIVTVDTTILTLIVNPNAKAAPDPATNKPAPDIQLRILSLLDDLSEKNATLIVPTPAISEALCFTSSSDSLITRLESFSCIEPEAFGMRAAIATAEIIKNHKAEIKKIKQDASKSWQHVKLDLLIVGVAIASGASIIYTDDEPQSRFASLAGLTVVHSWELQITGKHRQGSLFREEGST